MRSLAPPPQQPKTTSIRAVAAATPGTAPIPALIERGLRDTT
nr:hypothetical protein [Kibdelosporangium sp. MJ126-NF4]